MTKDTKDYIGTTFRNINSFRVNVYGLNALGKMDFDNNQGPNFYQNEYNIDKANNKILLDEKQLKFNNFVHEYWATPQEIDLDENRYTWALERITENEKNKDLFETFMVMEIVFNDDINDKDRLVIHRSIYINGKWCTLINNQNVNTTKLPYSDYVVEDHYKGGK